MAMARPWVWASSQHTASRSQCAGNAECAATLRRPAATSAPSRARAATARRDRGDVVADLGGRAPNAATGCAPARNSPDQHVERALQCGGLLGAAELPHRPRRAQRKVTPTIAAAAARR